MKRSNAAVRIPPNPPKSANSTFKPVQIGAPTSSSGFSSSASVPAKPKRGVPKSETATQFFYPQETLSDVTIAFSKQDSLDKQTLKPSDTWKNSEAQAISSETVMPGDNPGAQTFYENLPRQSKESTDCSDNVQSTITKCAELAIGLNTGPALDLVESDTNLHQSGHVKLRQCDTFDNLQIGPVSSPISSS